MINPPNKDSIQDRLNRIRKIKSKNSSEGSNSDNGNKEQGEGETNNISSKETSEMRNEFESVLQSGNMTKDKFAYFIQQANEMFQNYEKQLLFYKKKTSFFDYKDLYIENKDNNDLSFSLIPTKKEMVLRELNRLTEKEQKTLSEIKVAYTDKICELLTENETYKTMIDKLTFDVVNRLQEKINELGELLKKETKAKEALDTKLKSMDSVFAQNERMKEDLDLKDQEIEELKLLRSEHEENIKNLTDQMTNLQDQVERYLLKLEEKNKLIDNNENMIKALKKSLDEKEAIIEEKAKTLKEKESEIELLYTDNVKWEEKYNIVCKEIENFKKWSLWDQNLIESYKKIESLEQEKIVKDETIEKLNDEATHIKSRNSELTKGLNEIKEELNKIKQQNEAITIINSEYEKQKEKYFDYDTIKSDNAILKKELEETKNRLETQINEDKNNYEQEISKIKNEYETTMETQKQHYESLLAKKGNESENETKQLNEKINDYENRVTSLQKKIEELNTQIEKKNQALTNYKEVYDSMVVKLKDQEDKIVKLEQNTSEPSSSTMSMPTTTVTQPQTDNKMYSQFDKYAFTKEIMVDYLYCLFVCETGVTIQQIASNISKSMDLFLSNVFSEKGDNLRNPCIQCEVIKDICFLAYDKIIQKKMKETSNYDTNFYMINFEDFDSETVKKIVYEVINNNFITRMKPVKTIEQLSALFVKKYSKSFDFDANLADYVKDTIMPCVTSRINRISRMQNDEMRGLIELILHNIKDGKIYLGNKEVYSFEKYFIQYKKMKSLSNRNEKLEIENPFQFKEEIDNLIHNFKFEKPNGLYLKNCLMKTTTDSLEPTFVLDTILNNILMFLPKIQILSLPNNNLYGNVFINQFLEAIKLLKELTTLDLSNNNICDEDIKPFSEFLKGNKTLKNLILDNNKITSTGGFFFADALVKNKTLISLSLNKNEVNEGGFCSLLNVLTNNNSTLQHFAISDNKLSSDDFKAIAEYFNVNPPLISFDLSKNEIDSLSANEMGVALKKAKNLQIFNIQETSLNEESVLQLLNYISDTNISTLELDKNNFGQALYMLINKIKSATNLKKISFKQCNIVPEFLGIMAENLKGSMIIEEINLEENTFDEENLKKFCKEIEENPKIIVKFTKSNLPKKAPEIIGNNKNIILIPK